eukprot:SAG22_NODE_1055_length_5789_cov_3.943234_6_plen_302_part_00
MSDGQMARLTRPELKAVQRHPAGGPAVAMSAAAQHALLGAAFTSTNAPDMVWRDTKTGGAVFVGNKDAAKDADLLHRFGISRIVNCTSQLPNSFDGPALSGSSQRGAAGGGSSGGSLFAKPTVEYLRFDRIDVFSRTRAGAESALLDILSFFDPMFKFVDSATAKGENVLLHCVAGAHRAGTTACAYVMHKNHSLTADDAIQQCRRRRPVIDPSISDCLLELLHSLQQAHTGVAAPQPQTHGWNSMPNLDVEGERILGRRPAARAEAEPQQRPEVVHGVEDKEMAAAVSRRKLLMSQLGIM